MIMHREQWAKKLRLTGILISIVLLTSSCTTILSYRPRHIYRTVFNKSPTSSPPGTEKFEKDMSKLTKSLLTKGNEATPLFNGENVYPKLAQLIKEAKSHINFEIYIYRNDQTGKYFIKQLIKAKKQKNINIRLVTDDLGNDLKAKKTLKPLKSNGIAVKIFNPFLSWTILRFNNRNHRKVISADGTEALIMGLNIGNEYRGNGVSGFRDTAVHVKGPIVHEIEKTFEKIWLQAGNGWLQKDLPIVGINILKRGFDKGLISLFGYKLSKNNSIKSIETNGSCDIRFISSAPDNLSSTLLDMYLLAINSSQKRVYITTSYFVPPILLLRALKNAARRGVDVRILLQGKTDHNFIRQLAINKYGQLLKSGVKLYEWPYSILHAKTIVVDQVWSSIGSCNLDGRSFFMNYEANLAITNQKFAQKMELQFMLDIASSEVINYALWKKRKWYNKLIGFIITPIKGQF